MSDNKKYYYLKLKEDFFDGDAMIVMESMQDGYKYSNILLKLYLRSLKNEGKLMFNDRIPYNSTILAQVTRHSIGDVERAIKLFKEMDLIEVLDNGAIFISDIQNFVGESSTEGDRKREYRRKIEAEKLLLVSEGQESGQMSDKRPPEIEIEIEIEKEIEKEIKLDKSKPSNKLPENELKSDFDKLWALYPNKKGKAKAYTAYKKAIKDGATNKEIQNGITAYTTEIQIKRTEPNFIAHGSTWFSNQRWEDDYQASLKPQAFGLPDAPDKFQVKQEDIDAFEQMMGRKVTAEELEAMKGG